MDFLPRFYAENSPSWNTTDFTFSLSYIIAMKNLFHFFFTPQGIQYPPLDRCYSYKMLVFIKCAVFRKEFAVFLFPSAMSERQERIIIESLKFTGTIYTIIKCFKVIWKLISLVKISLTKQVSLLDLLSCDNIIKSYTHFFI